MVYVVRFPASASRKFNKFKSENVSRDLATLSGAELTLQMLRIIQFMHLTIESTRTAATWLQLPQRQLCVYAI